jgi:SAM-dependent methyltransferase
MPHSHQKRVIARLRQRLSPQEVEKELQRRKTKTHFHKIGDDLVEDLPKFFESPEFKVLRKHPAVRGFIRDFWEWNEKVLWLLNSTSHPYIELQEQLAKKVSPYLGRSIVDLGCGAGNFCARLFELNGHEVRKISAVDIDWKSLAQVTQTLKDASYRHKVALIQSSTMSELPMWSESVDCVVSSLGGIMYAGWWFEDGKMVCEGRDALYRCLIDINRILKPGGYLAFSTPRPNPNWGAVLRNSLFWLATHGKFIDLFRSLGSGLQAKKLSTFMHQVEKEGHAHYLSLEEWQDLLSRVGFEIIDSSFGEYYAKQGVIVIARKI